MAWFVRFTRFGQTHMVYAQERDQSCGIACAMMVNFKLNKFRFGAKTFLAEEEVYQAYSQVSGLNYQGRRPTDARLLDDVLNRLNIGRWEAVWVGEANVADAVIASVTGTNWDPIILLTNWVVGGGGHFVVVDAVNTFLGTHYASICDPWDGNVHIQSFTPGQRFVYLADTPRLSWDLGGTRHEYAAAAEGRMNGWIVRRRR